LTDNHAVFFDPGPGVALVKQPLLLLLDSESAEFAERLWAVLDSGGDDNDVLEELSTVGLRNLGSFAIASIESDDAVRIVVRGSGCAVVKRDDGTECQIEAGTARTWVETVVADPQSFQLSLGFDDVAPFVYRSESGLLPAARLGWTRIGESNISLEEVVGRPFTALDLDDHRPAKEVRADVPAQISSVPDLPLPTGNDEDDVGLTRVPMETVIRDRSPGMIGSVPPSQPPPLGDHDGHTMSRAQLQALRDGSPAAVMAPPPIDEIGGPPVLGRRCAAGHPNPAVAAKCRICEAGLVGDPMQLERPPLGVLTFSSGDRVVLDRPALIGRNPKAEGHYTETPNIVRLDVGSALSRSHALVSLEGWQVWIKDLGSQNGTTVTQPGRPALRLRSGEPVLLETGATVDFGGEVSASFDARVTRVGG